MSNKEDVYSFGECGICRKIVALKNGYCIDCEKKNPKMPEYFKDIFDNPYFGK